MQAAKTTKVSYENNSKSVSVNGIYGDYWTVRNIEVVQGRKIEIKDSDTLSKVAVVGPDIVTNIFGGENPIGKFIKINNTKFTVIGITETKGNNGISNLDEIVYVPLKTQQKLLGGGDSIRIINILSKSSETISAAETEVKVILRTKRNIKEGEENDFTIRNVADALATLNQVTSIFTSFLAAIAAISLLVGGIGIMNIMFNS